MKKLLEKAKRDVLIGLIDEEIKKRKMAGGRNAEC